MYSSTTLLKVQVPKGLPLLLHRLSKVVIQKQPENIYEFLANHLEESLKENKNDGLSPEEENVQSVENAKDVLVTQTFSVPKNDVDQLQNEYETARKLSSEGSENQNLIEKGSAKSKEETEVDIEGNSESSGTAELAATKIQAGFRGYKARKDIKTAKLKQQDEDIAKALKPPLTTIKEEEEAATKIQANIRGYLVRKKIKHNNEKSFDEIGSCIGDIIHAPKIDLSTEADIVQIEEESQPVDDSSKNVTSELINSDLNFQVESRIPEVEMIMKEDSGLLESQSKSNSESVSDSANVIEEEGSELHKDDPVLLAEIDKILEDSLTLVSKNNQDNQSVENQEDVEMNNVPTQPLELKNDQDNQSVEKQHDKMSLESTQPLESKNDQDNQSVEKQDDKINNESTQPLQSSIQEDTEKCPEPVSCTSPSETATSAEEKESPSSDSDLNTEIQRNTTETSEDIPLIQPRVQRRSTKRSRSPKEEKYRSGVILESNFPSVDTSATENMHIPSLEELDAEIEAEVLNQAATKIQAGFRGFQVRRNLNDAATRIQSNFRGYQTRKELQQQNKAAVRIQATVRGFLTRKKIYKTKSQQMQRRRSSAARKANKAATRIQAAYRGYAVRKQNHSDGDN